MIHSSSQRGIVTAVVALVAALALIGAGAVYYFSTPSISPGGAGMEEKKMFSTPTPAEVMMKKEGETTMKKEDGAMVKYSGTVLAGTSAPLLEFNKADFDIAVKSDKVVALYFFANWCPECAEEFPKMQAAFAELTTDSAVGFRVNYNDNQTDADETALAREYGVAYQHTKVLIKKGQQILKSPETWTKDRYLTEINKALGTL